TVLHAPGAVDLDLAAVVHPAHPELDHPLRLDQALHQSVAGVVGMALQERPQAGRDLLDRLQELRLPGIALLDAGEKLLPRKRHLAPLVVSSAPGAAARRAGGSG